MHPTRTIKLLAAVALAACGGADGLDPDVVTSLPPGNATGTAATGSYSMKTITTGCDGTCATTVNGFTYSACDIGTRLDSTATVTQADGRLTIDVEDSDYVSQLAGGLDADGTYDVGGLRTQQGGQIVITARSSGTLVGNAMTGSAQLQVSGMELDCRIDASADGIRD
jgi:hypothetical protein